jgi:hypothetical protein
MIVEKKENLEEEFDDDDLDADDFGDEEIEVFYKDKKVNSENPYFADKKYFTDRNRTEKGLAWIKRVLNYAKNKSFLGDHIDKEMEKIRIMFKRTNVKFFLKF